ncbi:uncharacterized protein TRIADDRAFT_25064 [Trichoplax adhaerens]|uniref:USP domain-containing protein n=1 Tax=Trichoplax adhaerens TaxID=10228 RepID=B3RX06_TRIAD|nr:hypothetical protein TRIADDRAFT_25064 [Trichoplax adhaerens]EDV25225.1 hypothetical protein TRIADDRAFT_25064 [Trichoplax adhaerens]|eukprot:XP_002113115.1 hypothetical protein TRIADDRAFT_25064 [Trichoplax adhaerens]
MTGENKYHCKFCTRKQGKPIEDKSTGKSSTKEAQDEPFLDVFKQEDKKFAPVYTVSTAQMLICELPKVVVLNLKRFEHVGASFRKLAKHITFPLQLDMLPFCTDDCKVRGGSNSTGLYELFGVVVHIGRLGGGHYSAYVKARTSQSDLMSEVTESIEQDDLKESALHDALQKLKECSMTFKQSDLRCQPGAWYHVSDLHVSKASENQVLKAQAYILFYKRLFVKG